MFDGWQSEVQERFAIDIYEQLWDGCEVIENDSNGLTEESARILDFGDVDKIIVLSQTQKQLAQRFRKPWFDKEKQEWVDPDFTLRYSRPTSDKTVEFGRLMASHDDPTASYPPLYSFGRVYNDHTRGIYELYILNTEKLISGIKSGSIPLKCQRLTREGQSFRAYELSDIESAGVIEKEWRESNWGDLQ